MPNRTTLFIEHIIKALFLLEKCCICRLPYTSTYFFDASPRLRVRRIQRMGLV